MAVLKLSCANGAVLDSSYLVIHLQRTDHLIPLDGTSPQFWDFPNISTIGNIAHWDLPYGAAAAPANGVWNSGTTYAVNNVVASNKQDFRSAAGTIYGPLNYQSLFNGNQGHDPDDLDGWWTCIGLPLDIPNTDWIPVKIGYLISPLITPATLASAYTYMQLLHSVGWTVAAPGDVVTLTDVYIKLNYKDGSGNIVPVISHPTSVTYVPGTQGQILNPGPQAIFQTWHTSGLSDASTLTLYNFEAKIVPDGNGMQPDGQVGVSYISAVVATGGTPPYTFTLINGELPPGTTLNSATGEISGIPNLEGFFTFTIQVTDSVGGTAQSSCTAMILPAPPVPDIPLFPFEFYEMQRPEDVETLPVPKKYDQLGPTRFDKIGKIFGFRIRLIVTGTTTTMPFKIYGDDSESLPNLNSPFYVGTFPVVPNIDKVYEIQLPKSVNTDVFRLALGPVTDAFHRYDVLIKAHVSGLPGQARWIPVR